MWIPTVVPDQRPRLIGDHVRGSVMIGHPKAECGRRTEATSRILRLTSTLAAGIPCRNAGDAPFYRAVASGRLPPEP